MRKRRFGVSLEPEVFEELDRAAKALGTDRSRVVSMATREYLAERFHFVRQHPCEGVIVACYAAAYKGEVDKLLESSQLIVSRSHFHSQAGCCVEVLYVRGASDSVWDLQAAMSQLCRYCRYIPVCT